MGGRFGELGTCGESLQRLRGVLDSWLRRPKLIVTSMVIMIGIRSLGFVITEKTEFFTETCGTVACSCIIFRASGNWEKTELRRVPSVQRIRATSIRACHM